jgi:hypothetical protein
VPAGDRWKNNGLEGLLREQMNRRRRVLRSNTAPIFISCSLMMPHCARAHTVPYNARRRIASIRVYGDLGGGRDAATESPGHGRRNLRHSEIDHSMISIKTKTNSATVSTMPIVMR